MKNQMQVLSGRGVSKGMAKGEALVMKKPFSFLGGVDPETGIITERGHEFEGLSVAGKILVFPGGKGSTGGSYALMEMKEKGVAPKALINTKTETIIAIGAFLAELPLVDLLEQDPVQVIISGDQVEVNGDKGLVKIF